MAAWAFSESMFTKWKLQWEPYYGYPDLYPVECSPHITLSSIQISWTHWPLGEPWAAGPGGALT
jgi:hypothetical protein